MNGNKRAIIMAIIGFVIVGSIIGVTAFKFIHSQGHLLKGAVQDISSRQQFVAAIAGEEPVVVLVTNSEHSGSGLYQQQEQMLADAATKYASVQQATLEEVSQSISRLNDLNTQINARTFFVAVSNPLAISEQAMRPEAKRLQFFRIDIAKNNTDLLELANDLQVVAVPTFMVGKRQHDQFVAACCTEVSDTDLLKDLIKVGVNGKFKVTDRSTPASDDVR